MTVKIVRNPTIGVTFRGEWALDRGLAMFHVKQGRQQRCIAGRDCRLLDVLVWAESLRDACH